MTKLCYGSYECKEECASCVLLYPCIDLTITIDHCDEHWKDHEEYRSYVEDLVDLQILRQINEHRGGGLFEY